MSSGEVERTINELVRAGVPFSAAEVVEATSLTRQAVNRHLLRLVVSGDLVVSGKARATRYQPRALRAVFEAEVPTLGLAEDRLWRDIKDRFPELKLPQYANAVSLVAYAFTEIVNNAIDHSNAKQLKVEVSIGKNDLVFHVKDEGIGAFRNVQEKLGLEDLLSAVQQISKGKTTTQPQFHTGEGLFFSSKVADRFSITANGLAWDVDNTRNDMSIRLAPDAPGTHVQFEVALTKQLSLETLFSLYTHDFVFDTTRTVVKMFEYGVQFVSRSEAKRLLNGLEKFSHVVIDFAGVQGVGQGFADEVFRVWALSHPSISVTTENMVAPVAFMVERARIAKH